MQSPGRPHLAIVLRRNAGAVSSSTCLAPPASCLLPAKVVKWRVVEKPRVLTDTCCLVDNLKHQALLQRRRGAPSAAQACDARHVMRLRF